MYKASSNRTAGQAAKDMVNNMRKKNYSFSIENPEYLMAHWGVSQGADRYTPYSDNITWDTEEKSLYDPCPAGWRVMREADAEADVLPAPRSAWNMGYRLTVGGTEWFWPSTNTGSNQYTDDVFIGKDDVECYRLNMYSSFFGITSITSTSHLSTFRVRCVRDGEREVGVQNPGRSWSEMPYVGAFWRNDPTGERIISGKHTGPWSAEIEGGVTWAKLSTEQSKDPLIFTSGPGDAESYPVEGLVRTVSGTGNIYFRIGVDAPLPAGAAPRYARVEVTHSGGTSVIYLRHGEQPDHLLGSTYKWSPYNMTDLAGRARGNHEGVDLGYRGGEFTEYPSQTGYMFQWNSTWGFNFSQYFPLAHDHSGRGNTWNLGKEVCPAGWKTPDATAFATGLITPNDLGELPAGSIGSNGLYDDGHMQWIDNVLSGCYADGFFDRRKVTNGTDMIEGVVPSPYTRIGGNTSATHGALFYDGNRSLFMPAGMMEYLGPNTEYDFPWYYSMCVYRTSTPFSVDSHATFLFLPKKVLTEAGYGPFCQGLRDFDSKTSMSIRCVKE
jgi:hypothetical protein